MKMNTEKLIERAKEVHGDTYDYSLVDYKNNHTKVIIICPIHGNFEQVPKDHIGQKKCGCNKCGVASRATNQRLCTESFTEKAKLVHGEKFTFDNVVYVDSVTKVSITCPEHGDYLITPAHCLSGIGCAKCHFQNAQTRGWNKTRWVEFCNEIGCEYPEVYIVRLFNEDEEFIKIGMSSDTKERLRSIAFKREKLNVIIGKPQYVWDLEKKLHKIFKKYKYKPIKSFKGETECFSTEILKDLNFQMFLQK